MVEEKFKRLTELRQSTEPTIKQIKKELGTRRRLEKKERKGREALGIVRRRRSIGGRIGAGIEKGFAFGRKGLTRTLQERDRPQIDASRARRLTPTGGVRTGKRGRPRGSVKFTDPRTGRPIGVFEHRKLQAQQRRLQVISARRQAAVTPRQQQVLRAIESRDRRQQMSGEKRVIPRTQGDFDLGGIMNDINNAANIVG